MKAIVFHGIGDKVSTDIIVQLLRLQPPAVIASVFVDRSDREKWNSQNGQLNKYRLGGRS